MLALFLFSFAAPYAYSTLSRKRENLCHLRLWTQPASGSAVGRMYAAVLQRFMLFSPGFVF